MAAAILQITGAVLFVIAAFTAIAGLEVAANGASGLLVWGGAVLGPAVAGAGLFAVGQIVDRLGRLQREAIRQSEFLERIAKGAETPAVAPPALVPPAPIAMEPPAARRAEGRGL